MADYVKPVQRGLESIKADKFPASFEANLQQTNQSLEFLSKVVLVMQRGIDEADDTIFDDIKQLVDELIIIFGGGTLGDDASFPGLNIFDVLLGNLGSFLGFNPASGGLNVITAANDFIQNILFPTNKLTTPAQLAAVNTEVQQAKTSAQVAAALAGQAQQSVGVKVNLTDIRTSVPLWQTLREGGFASFPRSNLQYRRTNVVSVSTGTQVVSGSNHTHVVPAQVLALVIPTYGYVSTQAPLSFVRAEKDAVIGSVTYVTRTGNSASIPSDYRIRCWIMDKTTGATTPMIPESPNQAPVVFNANEPSVLREVNYVFPEAVLVQAGDILVFGVSSRDSLLTLAAGDIWKPETLDGTYPRGIGGILDISSGSAALPDAITYANITWSTAGALYAVFEPTYLVSTEKRIIDDNFDRPDGPLGDRWRISSTQAAEGLRIINNQAEWGGLNPNNDGHSIGTYFSPLATDKSDGRVVVGYTNGDRLGYIFFRMSADSKKGAVIAFNATNIYLGYMTSPSSYVFVQSAPQSIGAQTIIEWAVNVNQYVVYVNGVLKLNFNMPNSQVPVGPGVRYFGIRSGRSNFGDGPKFDRVYYQDTPDVMVVEE